MEPSRRNELSPRAAPSKIGHLYPLDAARGIAALAVAAYHWVHFFGPGLTDPAVEPARLPFASLFSPIYVAGFRAVPLFFSLSGFIFFWLYRRSVADGRITAGAFAWRRFSRLYPLHLATLLLVAGLQIAHRQLTGATFADAPDDLTRFVAQLFLVTAWWPPHIGFNGVAWSIAVEIIMYGVFFAFARRGWLDRWLAPVLLCGLGYILEVSNLPLVGHNLVGLGTGFFFFFLGGLSCFAWEWLERSRWPRAWSFAALALAIVLALVAERLRNPAVPLPAQIYEQLGLAVFMPAKLGSWLAHLPRAHLTTFAFPALLIALGLAGSRWPGAARRCEILGQMSYSSYLLHLPLQIGFSLAVGLLGWPRTCFYSPVAFLLYFAILIAASVACFRYFEKPAQDWLRRCYVRRAPMPPRSF